MLTHLIKTVVEAYTVIGVLLATWFVFQCLWEYLGAWRAWNGSLWTAFTHLAEIGVVALILVFFWPWRSRFVHDPENKWDPTRIRAIAVDFDGVIAEKLEEYNPDEYGPMVPHAKDAIHELRTWGLRIVIWTRRTEYKGLRDWLGAHGIEYDTINEEAVIAPSPTRKILASVYVDDHNVDTYGERFSWIKTMRKLRAVLQPPLTTEIDDAQAWSCAFNRCTTVLRRWTASIRGLPHWKR